MSVVAFEDTGLLPAIVAEDVLRQRGITDLTLIDYVEQKTEHAYRFNEPFRRKLHSVDPRGCYRQYVEHWIEGEHRRRQKIANLRFQESQQ